MNTMLDSSSQMGHNLLSENRELLHGHRGFINNFNLRRHLKQDTMEEYAEIYFSEQSKKIRRFRELQRQAHQEALRELAQGQDPMLY